MQDIKNYSLLSGIDDPDALRNLDTKQLPQLADELRAFLIQSLSVTGGHLASSLGAVELTIALHYVFNTPNDRLVWDVGHQTYPHKIFTGRRERMDSLRQKGGLSGFTKRAESPYDTFGVGHSSTSISAALGMALAAQHQEQQREVVAIIGDGAMTAGMAFEALNHAGTLDANLLVILNDNDMSISPNVGGLSNYLTRILSSHFYTSVRESSKRMMSKLPSMWKFARRAEEHVKGMVTPGTLFEELGFDYFGPIDGHDLDILVSTLTNLSRLKGPRFLHVVTRKGKGFPPAEENPCTYHGVGRFDPETGQLEKKAATGPSYTSVFSDWLCDMAAMDERLIGITPAMREGSGLVKFSERYPDRYYDVGIAEQHAVTLAAGLACDDLKPVVAIYSTFLQRAYDQLIHDVAIQTLPVLFAIDRAGVVGPDGATHAGSFDLSYLRCIPNMMVMAPADENECRQMLYTGFLHDGPCAVRYPRGTGPGTKIIESMSALPVGRADVLREGQRVALLCFGSTVQPGFEAGEQLNATVVNMRFVKPLDEDCVLQLAETHDLLITVEDNAVEGGAGSGVNECLAKNDHLISIRNVGLPDRFLDHASREELLHEAGLDRDGIITAVQETLAHPALAKRATLA